MQAPLHWRRKLQGTAFGLPAGPRRSESPVGGHPHGQLPGSGRHPHLLVGEDRPRTVSMPFGSRSTLDLGSSPTQFVRTRLSRVTIRETFATKSPGRPVIRAGRRALPGALAQRVFVVIGTQTAAAIRLRLKASHRTTTTGLRNPGPEPAGGGKSARQTSPCPITARTAPGSSCPRPGRIHRVPGSPRYTLDLTPRSLHPVRDARHSRPAPPRRHCCGTFLPFASAARFSRKGRPESIRQPPYRQYDNCGGAAMADAARRAWACCMPACGARPRSLLPAKRRRGRIAEADSSGNQRVACENWGSTRL